MSVPPRPPRWAERLVERAATGSAAGPSVAGDLWEEWERIAAERGGSVAGRWYVHQALAVAASFTLRRGWGAVAGIPPAVIADARHAVRVATRSPGFVVVAVLSLGGGLGLTTAVFALVNGLLFAPLPWPDSERLVDLDVVHPREVCAGCSVGVPFAAFEAWRGMDGLEAIGAMEGVGALLTGSGGAERIQATAVSAEVPGLLGLDAAAGRLFSAEEHSRAGVARVAVLSAGLWMRRYGGDPAVLGRTVAIDGEPHEIIGVLPTEARFLDRGELWLPLEGRRAGSTLSDRGLWVFGRLALGADVAAVAQRLTSAHASLAAANPRVDGEWTARVRPMRSTLIDEVGEPAVGWIFLLAAGAVLFLACINLAALLLARVTDRDRELRVRAALGAGGIGLARLVLVEAALVAGAGAVAGLVVTVAARTVLVSAFGAALPPWVDFPLDGRVLGVGMGGAGLAVLACGFTPALRAARGGTRGVLPGSSSARDPWVLRRHRWLLAIQVAVGVALVASTALSTRTLQRVSNFDDMGFRTDGIVGVRVETAGTRHSDGEARAAFRAAATEALNSHPAVTVVTSESQLFIGSWGAADGPSPMWIEGRAEAVPDRIVPRHSLAVGGGYFDLFEVAIVRGRAVDDRDGASAPRVAVVNRAAARLLWPADDALGARFTLDNGAVEGPVTVVGIASDIVLNPMSESRATQPRIYFAVDQVESSGIVFRAAYQGAPPSPREWAGRIATVDPSLPIDAVTTVRQELERWISPVVVTAGLMGTLGGLTLVLLALGVFGTLSFQVAARTREIGIRRALGAGHSRLVRETARELILVLGAGIGGGIVIAAVGARFLDASFIQIGTTDPLLLLVAAAVVVVAAGLAAARPIRHALAVDPLESLRAD